MKTEVSALMGLLAILFAITDRVETAVVVALLAINFALLAIADRLSNERKIDERAQRRA